MTKLYFCNDGYYDVNLALVFGLSGKESDNPIGRFGTGFKYAIAIINRLGGTIKVNSKANDMEEDLWEFSLEEINFRGTMGNLILCNGEKAGFTTHLGEHWEPWQAYRELYSNCLDEGGQVFEDTVEGEWDTIIEVDCDELTEAHRSNELYFLKGEPLYSDSNIDIYQAPTEGCQGLFFKGVRVGTTDKCAAYQYNIKSHIDLTEDRTIKSDWDFKWYLSSSIKQSTDKSILRNVLTRDRESFEHKNVNWTHGALYSDELVEVCNKLTTEKVGIPHTAREFLKTINPESAEYVEIEISKVDKLKLEKAKDVLRDINIDIDLYPIKVVTGLGDGVIGQALDGVIYLSDISFTKGTKEVTSVLLEEWVHLHENARDFDYKMQTWLFDKIISLAEELRGEPV